MALLRDQRRWRDKLIGASTVRILTWLGHECQYAVFGFLSLLRHVMAFVFLLFRDLLIIILVKLSILLLLPKKNVPLFWRILLEVLVFSRINPHHILVHLSIM